MNVNVIYYLLCEWSTTPEPLNFFLTLDGRLLFLDIWFVPNKFFRLSVLHPARLKVDHPNAQRVAGCFTAGKSIPTMNYEKEDLPQPHN